MSEESDEVEEVSLDPGDLPEAKGSSIEMSEDPDESFDFVEGEDQVESGDE